MECRRRQLRALSVQLVQFLQHQIKGVLWLTIRAREDRRTVTESTSARNTKFDIGPRSLESRPNSYGMPFIRSDLQQPLLSKRWRRTQRKGPIRHRIAG